MSRKLFPYATAFFITALTSIPLSSQNKILVHHSNGEDEVFINVDSITYSQSSAGRTFQSVHVQKKNYETPIDEIESVAFGHLMLCPDKNHPHIIDLGLPSGTKWSCCNMGAQTPEDNGAFYAWGEAEEKLIYNDETYIYAKKSGGHYDYQNLGSNICGTEYDVVHTSWGGDWQIPSIEQTTELLHSCTSQWITINGVEGELFTSRYNHSSIFMPAAGYRYGSTLLDIGGFYWTGSRHPDFDTYPFYLYFHSEDANWGSYGLRSVGLTLRPIVSAGPAWTNLSLSRTSPIRIRVGVDYTIDIKSGNGSYSVESSNLNVASSEIKNNTIVIHALKEGKSTVSVTDKQSGQKVTIVVTVLSGSLTSHTHCPDGNHPHLIDLGLPSGTKWACCNVGAINPEGYGGYYSWGETEEKSVYNDLTYPYSTGIDMDEDGWYDSYWMFQDPGSSICNSEYDVANLKWGCDWLMPTMEQLQELICNCTHRWTTVNGVEGLLFTSNYNDGSIFLPAAGYRKDSRFIDLNGYGYYWTGTQDFHQGDKAYRLRFPIDIDIWDSNIDFYHNGSVQLSESRSYGLSVRPVAYETEVLHTDNLKPDGVLDEKSGLRVRSACGYEYSYGEDGRLQNILFTSDSRRYEFLYNPDKIILSDYDGYIETYSLIYNKDGFISSYSVDEVYEDWSQIMNTSFSYDSVGHLTKVIINRMETEYNEDTNKTETYESTEVYTLDWKDNLLMRISKTDQGTNAGGLYHNESTYRFEYSSMALANYANKYKQYCETIFPLNGLMMRLSYVGLLGYGPDWLPSRYDCEWYEEEVDKDGVKHRIERTETEDLSYSFNKDGSLDNAKGKYSTYNYSYDNKR